MTRVTVDYFKGKITSLELAKEIIETSDMKQKTRETFLFILSEAEKGDIEAEDILKERLAGWLCENQPLAY